ncbi:MAG: tRNA epoxyqueuosine(34) reductase QueG [Hyphomicrobium sp.]|nr:tRNA epoxyqueuosine(34) reductase QueG [Hyphomicrobium sp.]
MAEAAQLGFDAIGVARLDGGDEAGQRLRAFLDHGRHGDMQWLAATADRRADPRVLWPQARSAILVGLSYAPDGDPLAALSDKDRAVISVYAKGRDYHDVLKTRIKQLARSFARATGADVKVFVDTAPLMEKPLAAAAGLGWQGKHTNLVSRSHGSWLFLGAILTTAELEADAPEADYCGSCRRCVDVCPTDAFPAPYQLDARRCLAYLSIEHKGPIPHAFRSAMGNRVFGCDDCLAVCPWNKFAERSREAKFSATAMTDNPPIATILAMDDATFRASFAGTPIKRTGRDRVVRNASIAAGNSGNADLMSSLTPLLADASPLVRGAAVWAASKLVTADAFERLRSRFEPREHDAEVAAEWRADDGDRAA